VPTWHTANGHGALISVWPAQALAGSFELLRTRATPARTAQMSDTVPIAGSDAPPALTKAPSVEQTVRAWHNVGHSQRAIARELNIDRRKVRRILDQDT